MEINKNIAGNQLEIVLKGRLDTSTAPDFEKNVMDDLGAVKDAVINMKEVEYVSSAGLRSLLSIHKTLTGKGGVLKLKSVNDEVMEVLDMTGFSTFLTIED